MSAPTRLICSRLGLVRRRPSASPWRSFTSTSTVASREGEPWPQRTPLGPYYESIIQQPTPYPFEEKPEQPPDSAAPEVQPAEKKPAEDRTVEKKPAEKKPAPPARKKKPGRKPKPDAASASSPSATVISSSSPPAPSPPPPPAPATTAAERARIVFGSRLLGPAEQADRLATKKAQSTYVAGVLVPPQPEEPDNCCMSGCVDCVWDRYREDMEEWSAKKSEAQMRLDERSGSMDADGGGSDANWDARSGDAKIAKDLWDDSVFENVPVGIREFMKHEKRLREKHQREGTTGG
ncbi:hypothetical protein CDD83_3593 [Cordyceps sp. RAO-2017]|nr:hypothetical protein CDD83_3593 [Cordyceps sp. RAO-2017]